MARLKTLSEEFSHLYGEGQSGIRCFTAPGRVNLIGEHTDYNGGYVFPAALTFGTTLLLRKNDTGSIRFASLNRSHRLQLDLNHIFYDPKDDWVNYPKAIIHTLMKEGYKFGGYDLLYSGDIPGSGLSSSASLQLVTAYALMAAEGYPLEPSQLALTAQISENEFMGVQCGIMDQFTVAMGKKDHAILLRCSDLKYEYVPIETGQYRFVIANTNKARGLVDSAYNERREQCERALYLLRHKLPDLQHLSDLSSKQFAAYRTLLQDPTVRNRAEHVITENERVLASVDALKQNDLVKFGMLMNESHISLRDLYEVSCHELDVLVSGMQQVDGVIGARMTGAGFGGCAVALVHESQIEQMIEQVGILYAENTELEADFYVCDIGDGVKELDFTK